MPVKGYTTIALPNVLIKQVEEIIDNKKYGYILSCQVKGVLH